jgi:hypothetical protein
MPQSSHLPLNSYNVKKWDDGNIKVKIWWDIIFVVIWYEFCLCSSCLYLPSAWTTGMWSHIQCEIQFKKSSQGKREKEIEMYFMIELPMNAHNSHILLELIGYSKQLASDQTGTYLVWLMTKSFQNWLLLERCFNYST